MRPSAWLGSSCLRVVCAALALCAVAPSAAAEEKGKDKDKAVLEARQKFRQAISLQTGGNWAGALALFRDVAAVKNTPQVLFNIAICEENLGQLVQALGDYQLAAAQARDEISDVAGEVDGRLTALKERIPKVTITRGANANLAKISIDGVEVGATMIGQPMPVDPGGHSVGAELRGYEKFEKAFEVAEKGTITVEVALTPAPNMEDSPYGSAPGPSQDRGTTAEKKPNILPWVVGGVGVASLAASGVFFILRQGAISDLDAACPSRVDCPPELESKRDSGKMFSTLSAITLGVGVVGVGTGVTLLLVGNKSGKSPEAALTLGAPSAHAGASVVGRF